jgi:hypothetical protein
MSIPRLSGEARRQKAKGMIRELCEKKEINSEELRAGSADAEAFLESGRACVETVA